MPSWNDPSNTNPVHTNVLEDLGKKDTYALTMGQEDPGYTDLPTGTMTWDNNQKILRRREGGTPLPAVLSLAGGGTGATDAAGARTVLQVNKSGTADGEARTNAQNDLRYVKLVGGFDAIKEAATSTETGVVKLNNTLTSTATDAALTAAQGKVLKDSLDGYFQVVSVSAPSGDFTSGGMKISKSGNSVTISNDTSGAGFSHSSQAGPSSGVIIPIGLRPIQIAFNCYYSAFGDSRTVSVKPDGTINFVYSDSNGNLASQTSTGGFTISYTV